MTLTPDQRARLDALAQQMVPGGAGMPGWDSLGLNPTAVDHVLAVEPAWAVPLVRFLSLTARVDSLAGIEALAQADRDGFQALGVVIANAYFMDPRVRAAIGYPGQEARDSSVGLTEGDLALVDEVLKRGPIYRPA
jgi:hypothetical protein